ncbi:MAG: repressor LexA [Desulfobacterales bacterium CG23_combo_of_CG06-09_8_20_14_all_51_8]|nr:MAG: repressor LexA [Desulfobacterales bacterium CG23_combo_of_CG06-09_8_20_14_all_51_8]
MQLSLTPKQKRLLDYLRERLTETGIFPSLRQAAHDLGISHTAVAQMLKLLETKELIRREGRYQRTVHLINPDRQPAGLHRWKEVPVIGRITAGLPMYAQQEWNGSLVVDSDLYKGTSLFALYVIGDSMINAGILNGDIAICEPRQYAGNGEIIVALIHQEEATVKRFFVREDHILLQPENPDFKAMRYNFDEVLVQGKVIGIQRGPDVMQGLHQ